MQFNKRTVRLRMMHKVPAIVIFVCIVSVHILSPSLILMELMLLLFQTIISTSTLDRQNLTLQSVCTALRDLELLMFLRT
ncbi:MAG: hypothetical protein CMH17_00150 [Methylophaga sp.]|nr:hypothetical protein [Methylophaga sp.]